MHSNPYNHSQWRPLRIRVIARAGGKCEMCGSKLRAGRKHHRAAEVDHKTPHRGDMKLFLDFDNLQALCKTCHSSTKQRMERGTPRMQRNDGW